MLFEPLEVKSVKSGQIWAKKWPDRPIWTKLQKIWLGLAPSGQIQAGAVRTKTWLPGSGLPWECHGSYLEACASRT